MAMMMGHAAMAQGDCTPLIDQMYSMMDSGNLAKAIECGEKAKACLDKNLSDKHNQDYFDVMSSLAQCYQYNGNFAKGQKCYIDMLEVMENAGDTTSNFYLALISSVPSVSSAAKDFNTSLRYYDKLLNSMAYKEGISLGSTSLQGWKAIAAKAMRILEHAPQWKVVSFEDNFAFPNLGNDLTACNENKLAIDLLSKTCNQMRLKNMAATEGYLSAVSKLASAYTMAGDHENEYQSYNEAYNLSKALHGENDPNTQRLRSMLSRVKAYGADAASVGKKGDKNSIDYNIDQFWLKYNQSLYQEASVFGQKAIDLIRKQTNTNPESLISFMNAMGSCLVMTEKPQQAIDYYNGIYSYLKDNNMENTAEASVIMQNIAAIYFRLGDLENEIHYRASAMRIMASIYNLEYQKAGLKTKLDEIIAISKAMIPQMAKLNDKQAEEVMTSIIGSSNIMLKMNRNADYENLYNSMIEILDEGTGRNNIAGFRLIRQMGVMYWDKKQYTDAKRYFETAELISIQVFGYNSYENAQTLMLLSNAQSMMKDYTHQHENLNKAAEILRQSLGEQSNEYIHAVMDIARVYINLEDYPNAAAFLDQWLGLVKKQIHDLFAFMTIQEKTAYYEEHIEPYTNDFFIMAQNCDKFEKSPGIFYDYELLSKGMLLSSETEFNNYIRKCDNPEIQSLYAQYRENGEFIKAESRKPEAMRDPRYNDLRIENSNIGHKLTSMSSEAADLSQNIGISWQDVRKSLQKNDVAIEFIKSRNNIYQALVISPKIKAPEAVYLFEERELKMKIAQATTKDCDFIYMPYESTAMYDIIWKKLEKYLTPGASVYFAPKGIIHTLAIEYAPIGGDSIFCQRYQPHRISSTRNLATKARNIENKNAVVYGGIEYNYRQESGSNTRGESINFLPGTLQEMDDISACLAESGVGITKYSGSDATAQSMEQLSDKAVNILHIATHGIFRESGTSSLDNSGLAMADQIITSTRISQLDLSGTNLVVLSACETAKGTVTGDGVFGLQRGFKLAGAKSLIMSLWPVNDQSTRIMMTDFYNNIYKNNMNKRDAFYRAVVKMKDRKGATPFNWAAFIMLD